MIRSCPLLKTAEKAESYGGVTKKIKMMKRPGLGLRTRALQLFGVTSPLDMMSLMLKLL